MFFVKPSVIYTGCTWSQPCDWAPSSCNLGLCVVRHRSSLICGRTCKLGNFVSLVMGFLCIIFYIISYFAIEHNSSFLIWPHDILSKLVPAHTALSIREFLAKKNIAVLPHPPYSPDLAPCDFCLFPKLKSKFRGHHFGTIENIQKTVTDELHTLTENDFRYCYDQWKKNVGTTV